MAPTYEDAINVAAKAACKLARNKTNCVTAVDLLTIGIAAKFGTPRKVVYNDLLAALARGGKHTTEALELTH